MQPLLLNFVHGASIQFAIRRTVYDQSHLLGLEIQLLHQCRDPSRRLNAPAGAITDQNCHIHGGKQATANMLHARFVIHHKIRVVCLQSLNLGLHQSIHKAIAALALGAAHDHQVKILFLCNGILQPHLQVVTLGHARRNGRI